MPSGSPCFPEPDTPDETYQRRRESRASFLARSTWSRAVETRAFYNDALGALPGRCAKQLCARLHAEETEAATFEMVVGRLLQLRGATTLVCEPGGDGPRPDWRADFSDGTLHVEAMVPLYNAEAGKTMRRRTRLLDYLEERAPAGWWLLPLRLPRLNESEPLKAYKRLVDELLATLPPADAVPAGERREIAGALPQGVLRISARSTTGRGGLGSEGGVAYFDNSELRLRAAWRDDRKRRQGRSAPRPALLAIQGGFAGADLEDFEHALFGHDISFGRNPDGEMATDRDPPWAGVLAFPEVTPAGARDPVLFRSPWYADWLPASILALEVRELVGEGVVVTEASDTNVFEGMRWAEP